MTTYTLNDLLYAKGTSEPVRQMLLAMAEEIERLKAAQPEPSVEPVGIIASLQPAERELLMKEGYPLHAALYTAPPHREWQGLTDEEIKKLSDECIYVRDETDFIRAIEAKLKEKNGF